MLHPFTLIVHDNCPGSAYDSMEEFYNYGFSLCNYPDPDVEFDDMDKLYKMVSEDSLHRMHFTKQIQVSNECGALLVCSVFDYNPLAEGEWSRENVWSLLNQERGIDPQSEDFGYELVRWGDLYILSAGLSC